MTMYEDGMRKASRGVTTFEEVLRVTREELIEPSRRCPSTATGRESRRRRRRSGELEAANEREIVDRLRDQGLHADADRARRRRCAPTAARAAAKRTRAPLWFAPKRVTRDQLLAHHARARDAAARRPAARPRARDPDQPRADRRRSRALLQGIRDDVRGGKSLSQALDARRDVFSRFYVNIVRAGEAGGALGDVLQRLADTMERNKELRDSVNRRSSIRRS